MAKTIESRNETLALLSSLTPEELEGVSVQELRRQVPKLGITGILRNGVETVPVYSARKAELLQTIQAEISAFQRASAPVSTEHTEPLQSVEVLVPKMPSHLYWLEKLQDIKASHSFKDEESKLQAAEVVGLEIARAIDLSYPDDIYMDRSKQRVNRQSDMFTAIKRQILKEPNASQFLLVLTDAARAQANKHRRTDSKKADHEYTRKVEERNEAQVVISGWQELLTWARSTIEGLSPTASLVEWKEVVVALAIVSGRRMNEIMCNQTNWSVGEIGLSFDVLSKSNKRDVEAACLCDPSAVVRAIKWLRTPQGTTQAKYVEDRKKVNERYSSDLAKYVRTNISLLPPDQQHLWSFHSFRKLYVLVIMRQLAEEGLSEHSALRTVASYMGHSSSDMTDDIYKQTFTLG